MDDDNDYENNQNEIEEDQNNEINAEQDQNFDENDTGSDNRFPEINEGGWIQWFCQLDGNEYFVEIDEEFIKNKINLIGIKCKPYLETILSQEYPSDQISEENIENLQQIKEIYGLIHKRFISTPKGLALMREKYLNGIFGHCPRILCDKQVLIPVGLSEDTKFSRVKVYCPICCEVYKPRERVRDMDGAYFGTSFPQIFFMAYPDLNPKVKKVKNYIPKLYGFRIFGKKGSKYFSKDKEELYEKMKKLNINLDYEL